MTYNKIYVSFGALRKITGPTISYQYDVQQILVINGLNLPEYYEVDFCNEGDTYTETIVGTVGGGVAIPNKFLRTGKKVKAYLVLVGDGDVQTRYEITLPVNVRPQRQDIDPTDDQQLQIDSLVAALNSGVASAEAAAKRADLEKRLEVLESAGIRVWVNGMTTAKGQTVLYAILKPEDTTLRYCRYDGGRDATALSPGKIDGWVVLASAGGEVTHRVEHDTDGKIILVPVNEVTEA